MKLILLLGIVLLNGCALMGVYGPEAQERAKEGLVQIGNSLDQITNTAARGVGAYANGYAQGYRQYQATQPPVTQQTGLINTPNGSALYHVDSNGNGIIYPPVGSGDNRAIMFHTDNLGNVWEY
jgi:hypothetical protein